MEFRHYTFYLQQFEFLENFPMDINGDVARKLSKKFLHLQL